MYGQCRNEVMVGGSKVAVVACITIVSALLAKNLLKMLAILMLLGCTSIISAVHILVHEGFPFFNDEHA